MDGGTFDRGASTIENDIQMSSIKDSDMSPGRLRPDRSQYGRRSERWRGGAPLATRDSIKTRLNFQDTFASRHVSRYVLFRYIPAIIYTCTQYTRYIQDQVQLYCRHRALPVQDRLVLLVFSCHHSPYVSDTGTTFTLLFKDTGRGRTRTGRHTQNADRGRATPHSGTNPHTGQNRGQDTPGSDQEQNGHVGPGTDVSVSTGRA